MLSSKKRILTGDSTAKEEPDKGWADFYDPGGADLFARTEELQEQLAREEKAGNAFFRRPLLSGCRGRARVRDPLTGREREVIMLGSNSYLGLSSDPRVVAASIEAARRYGYGTGAVSLYAGTTALHLELEKRIAAFHRCQDAILFPTGYAANVGVIAGLVRPRDTVVGDLFNHASIHDGCRLSGARLVGFAHGAMRRLERALAEARGTGGGTLVVTDGVFSMEGDLAKLDRIHELARAHGAGVMIDEAHALGVIGPTGRGTAEHFGLEGGIDLTVGTLSKAPGGIGGYATGEKRVIDYLRYYARPYFFSTSIPAPVAAGLIQVFRILEEDPSLHRALWRNIDHLKGNLAALGFDLGRSASAIVPVIVREEGKVKALLRGLWQAGIFANYVAFPAVPRRRCRIRMGVMAQHTREDLDRVIQVLADLGRKHGVI